MTTVGDLLDQGVAWDQFADLPWDGTPLFTSAEDAEAHCDDEVEDWPEDEL